MIFFYTNPILIAAAVIPAIFLLVHVYRADKLEKEPAPLLISLVLYGIAATFIALLLERFGSWLLGRIFSRGQHAVQCAHVFWASSRFQRKAQNISCSNAGHGAPPPSTASLTVLYTRFSLRWALRCGKISAMY